MLIKVDQLIVEIERPLKGKTPNDNAPLDQGFDRIRDTEEQTFVIIDGKFFFWVAWSKELINVNNGSDRWMRFESVWMAFVCCLTDFHST